MKVIFCSKHCACAQYFQILPNMSKYCLILNNIHVQYHIPFLAKFLHPAAKEADFTCHACAELTVLIILSRTHLVYYTWKSTGEVLLLGPGYYSSVTNITQYYQYYLIFTNITQHCKQEPGQAFVWVRYPRPAERGIAGRPLSWTFCTASGLRSSSGGWPNQAAPGPIAAAAAPFRSIINTKGVRNISLCW